MSDPQPLNSRFSRTIETLRKELERQHEERKQKTMWEVELEKEEKNRNKLLELLTELETHHNRAFAENPRNSRMK